MERKTRLGSAKSNASTYSNVPKPEPQKFYQENLQFPQNTHIETGYVQPAKPLELAHDDYNQRYDNRPTFESKPKYSDFQMPESSFEQRQIPIRLREEQT
jgi:hypothetical protein